MITFLKKILGFAPQVDYQALINEGGTIIDVRTRAEFLRGHIKGSQNIPLNDLGSSLKKIKNRNQPVITCCASGMRSASAKNLLESFGYTRVFNAGGWRRLENRLNQ